MRVQVRKILLLANCIVVIVVLGVVGESTLKLRSFRRHPTTAGARFLLENDWPNIVAFRYLMLRPGTSAYMSDVRGWIYKTRWLRDRWWNRAFLERDLVSMPLHARDSYLAAYRLSLTPRLRELAIQDLASGNYKLIPVLYRDKEPSSRDHAAEFIRREIMETGDRKLFVEAFPFILQGPTVRVDQLLDEFWGKLEKDEAASVIDTLKTDLGEETASDVLRWLEREVDHDRQQLNLFPAVIARLLNFKSSSGAALELVSGRIQLFDEDSLSSTLAAIGDMHTRAAVARQIFANVRDTMPALATQCLAQIAVVDVGAAERLAAPVLAGGDTELRKGVIVALADAQSPVGQRSIDEAFTGAAPRTRKFRSWNSYIYSSKAAQEYRTLSHHDYLETGKSWPPARFAASEDPDMIEKWRHFLETYPWFPGTDDAYYQLAFAQYIRGDLVGAIATIKEYSTKDLPDQDAEPYIMYLLRIICSRQDPAVTGDPVLGRIHTIVMNAPATVLWSHKPANSLVDALEWFFQNPQYIRLLGVTKEDFTNFRTFVLGSLTGGAQGGSPEGRRVPLQYLYGRFFVPATPKESIQLKLPDEDPADAAIATIVGKVSAIITSTEARGTPEFAYASDWVLWNMEEGSDRSLRKAYQSVFESLSRVPKGDLSPEAYLRMSRILTNHR